MQSAFRDRAQYLGDPDFVKVDTARLVERAGNGKVIGISFHEAGNGCDFSQIEHALERFHFPSDTQDILAASLKAH